MSALRQTRTAGWFALHIRTEFKISLGKSVHKQIRRQVFFGFKIFIFFLEVFIISREEGKAESG